MYCTAAEAAGVNRVTVFRERKENPSFAARELEAINVANMALTDEAVRRARIGVRKYKFGKGGEPIVDPRTGEQYYELEYSDTLLLKLLTCHIPEVYRDKMEHSGEMKHTHLTLEELKKRMQEAKA
jgi:hypothetical protein